jgi:hypothetical protein
MFCIVPAYFNRALKFSNLYHNAEKFVQQFIIENEQKDEEILLRNFQFIIGLILLKILKNRSSKCVDCQFSKRKIYKKIEEMIDLAIKDRSDVLSTDITVDLIEKYSEIPIFDGMNIGDDNVMKEIPKQVLRCADIFSKDLDFQIMVSTRRKDSRLKHIEALKEENGN